MGGGTRGFPHRRAVGARKLSIAGGLAALFWRGLAACRVPGIREPDALAQPTRSRATIRSFRANLLRSLSAKEGHGSPPSTSAHTYGQALIGVFSEPLDGLGAWEGAAGQRGQAPHRGPRPPVGRRVQAAPGPTSAPAKAEKGLTAVCD